MPVVAKWSLTLSVASSPAGWAQDYPAKPIRFVTSAAGGAGDLVSRTIAQAIAAPLGQPVLVDNRGSILGIELVSQARPDGYTLLLTSNVFWLLPLLRKVSFDPLRDFAPIALAVTSPNVIVTHPSLPVKSIRELVSFARARPGELNFAGGSPGSASHLAGEMFKLDAKVNMVYVPYKGAGPALNDTIAGHVHVLFSNLAASGPHVKSGRLRALAITSAKPSPLAPELPTVASAGLPNYESEAIYGLFGPAGVPSAVVQRLNEEVTRALKRPEIRERFGAAGSQIVAGSGADLGAWVAAESKRMGKVITEAGIRLTTGGS
ncbi:MAG: tripartite tricarboxylate transporter substrate binding protein [Betaproteobacteria bacterium]|nr:MAG: tripartite tricarboxylate transporter substrate binding protein [Betaproteobacteria bacterium]